MRLWEKYQPSTLSDVVGQPSIAALREFLVEPYACCLLFEGPPGTGKTSTALALAADLGCKEVWSGLEIVASVDLTIERARELFERTLRLVPMAGNGWRVLVIEELEACSSIQVQRYLKVVLDTGLPPRCVVIAGGLSPLCDASPLPMAPVSQRDRGFFMCGAWCSPRNVPRPALVRQSSPFEELFMSKHTPGPWECELGHENGDFQINSTGCRWKAIANATANVLGADAVYDDEAQANAKLIAAAPDMLKALNFCVKAMRIAGVDTVPDGLCSQAASEARAAIAKATAE